MHETLPFRYLAVDGPIGAGKTTLVEKLADRFESVKVLEDIENPFLGDFYRDVAGSAFQTELYFLLSRFKQQQDLVQPELFSNLLHESSRTADRPGGRVGRAVDRVVRR